MPSCQGSITSADVFCFPSVKEGWGLVVLEAIAAGLPVITANEPPFTEFLAPHQALLVPPTSISDLAGAMLTAANSDQAQTFIRHSRAIFAPIFLAGFSATACTGLSAFALRIYDRTPSERYRRIFQG